MREIVDTFMQLLCHLGDVPHVPQLVGLDVRQQAVADVLVGGAGGRTVAHHLWARIAHSLSECGFEILKTYQAPAHIWGLPR